MALDEEKNNTNKSKEQEKKQIAKTFGLSLEDIQHVILDNGHEFYKFKNPQDGTIKMIETINNKTNMNEEFKSSQKDLSIAQNDNEKQNALDIYNYNTKHKNKEVELITIAEFKSNRFKYSRIIRGLNTRIKTQIKFLLKSSEELKLRYINLEYGIGINENGDVIDVKVDFVNKHISLQSPKVINYENKSLAESLDNETIELSDQELEGILDDIIITDDIPNITEQKEINIGNESINSKTIIDMYNTPKLIDRMDMSERKRDIYRKILKSITKKINKQKQKTGSRQYVYQNTNKNDKAA